MNATTDRIKWDGPSIWKQPAGAKGSLCGVKFEAWIHSNGCPAGADGYACVELEDGTFRRWTGRVNKAGAVRMAVWLVRQLIAERRGETTLERYEKPRGDLKPKPCPFCGTKEVSVGAAAITTQEAVCENMDCRARVQIGYPLYMPEGCEDHDELREWLDAKVTKRWNRRAS